MSLRGRRSLFISYNGMLDPLGQSQVIPYLRELAREGLRFTLLSFERPGAWLPEGLTKGEELRQELAEYNIDWHRLRYHRWPSLPATFYDVIAGIAYSRTLVRRKRIELVHARSHIPATIGLALKKYFRLKLIFDLRGLMAEEYVDAGHWRKDGIEYNLTKSIEHRVLAASNGVVTLTEAIWPIIREWKGLKGRAVAHTVVPCCADLDRFRFDPAARDAKRGELGVAGKFVVVYSGSIGGWYLTGEMADFFANLSRQRPDAHFLWLTPGSHDTIRTMMRERGLVPDQYTIRSAAPAEVPSYLSASDLGLAFIKPCFSKLASSPTKTAEYLACGLPIVINTGVGDSDLLVTREKVGVMVTRFEAEDYTRAVMAITPLLGDVEKTRLRTRQVATEMFDVRGVGLARYLSLYEEVYGS